MVVFWKQFETKDRKTGEPKNVPVFRYYNVFNAEQCEGIPAPDAVPFQPLAFTPIESAEAIARGYAGGPALEHVGDQNRDGASFLVSFGWLFLIWSVRLPGG